MVIDICLKQPFSDDFLKWVFLHISQYLKENTCVFVEPLLNICRRTTLLKRDFNTGAFL